MRVAADPVLAVVAHALVELADALTATTVAEGIEPEDDATALAGLGVSLLPGWHFDRATTAADLRVNYQLAQAEPTDIVAVGAGTGER